MSLHSINSKSKKYVFANYIISYIKWKNFNKISLDCGL